MTPLTEPFLSTEIEYRQQLVRQQFPARGRRFAVRRRHGLHLPHGRRRPLLVA